MQKSAYYTPAAHVVARHPRTGLRVGVRHPRSATYGAHTTSPAAAAGRCVAAYPLPCPAHAMGAAGTIAGALADLPRCASPGPWYGIPAPRAAYRLPTGSARRAWLRAYTWARAGAVVEAHPTGHPAPHPHAHGHSWAHQLPPAPRR